MVAKLNGIESLADKTDAANVQAAGAIMNVAAGNGIDVVEFSGTATVSADYTISTSAPSGTPDTGHVWYRY
jgi:hypothetical protein